MTTSNVAIILVGYQNDYFAEDGILRGAIEESSSTNNVIANTMGLIDAVGGTDTVLIQTPIIFTEDYSELHEPVGILKTIVDVQAFKAGTSGAEVIPELIAYGDRVITVEGKRGLNAFSNTALDAVLEANGVEEVVLAGAVTSICIDSTGRAAHERGYRVTILSDCTAGRTNFEQNFYCENIFPLYARVMTAKAFLGTLLTQSRG
jgi:nicotinamidase-related amidase